MKCLAILALSLTLAACGTLTRPINTIHTQLTGKLKADFVSVKEVGAAAGNTELTDCADTILSVQIPPIEALDRVQVAGAFSTLALVEAKREALKIKPVVAQKCSAFGWLLGQFELISRHL